MSNQGTIRLKVTNSAPAIEKLWNNRYKLEFFCDNNSPKEDWYYENVSALLPNYGILQTTNFGSGVSEDWEAIPNSVYPDMRLVLAEYPYNVRAGKHYVKLTYETLTASWVEEKAEDTDYELNGLKRVSRTFVALPATTYDKVVGTSTIDSNGTTLYLGSFKIEETDAKWSLSEVWLEAGELSREENSEDAKGSINITQIGGCPEAPAGYTVVNESKNNTQGFETCSRTFYKDDSELSRSNDYVGSQLAESIEVFSPTVEPTPTNFAAVLGSKSTSNVDGIPTIRYTFLVPSVLSTSEDKIGSQLGIIIEAFSEIPTTPAGYVIANKQTSEVEGIPTVRYTFLKNNIILSELEDKVGSQLSKVQEWFNPTVDPSINNYVIASTRKSEIGGIPTKRFTFLKPSIISIDQQFSESDSKITIVAFNLTSEEVSEALDEVTINHRLIEFQSNDYEGIATNTYTYTLDLYDVVDFELNGLRRITRTTLLPSGTIYNKQINDIQNFPSNGIGSSVQESMNLSYFNVVDTTKYRIVDEIWLEPGLISQSKKNISEGLSQWTEVALIEEPATWSSSSNGGRYLNAIEEKTDNVLGIKTFERTFMVGPDGLGLTGQSQNEYTKLQLQYSKLVDFTYPGVLSIGNDLLTLESTEVGDEINLFNFRLDAPVQSKIQATVSVFYQYEPNILQSDYEYGGSLYLWNPTSWAKTYESGIGWSFAPFASTQGFRGYRASRDNPNIIPFNPPGEASYVSNGVIVFQAKGTEYLNPEFVGNGWNITGVQNSNGTKFVIGGKRLFGKSCFNLSATGGPENPENNTYTLNVEIAPAFETADGTTVYKKIIVHATIPEQETGGQQYNVNNPFLPI